MDKRGEGSRKQLTHPSARGGESGARAGGEGLRITGWSHCVFCCNKQPLVPSLPAQHLHDPARNPCPPLSQARGGRKDVRRASEASWGEDHPPGLWRRRSWGGSWLASSSKVPLAQAPCSRSSRKPSRAEGRRGGGSGGRGSGWRGAQEHALPAPAETPMQGGPPGFSLPPPPRGPHADSPPKARGGLPALGAVPGPPDPRRARWQAGGEQRPERRGAGLLRRNTGRKDARAAPLRKGHLWKRNGG